MSLVSLRPSCMRVLLVGLADCRSVWVSRGMPAEYRSVSMLDRQGEQTDDVSTYQTDAVNASSPMYVQDKSFSQHPRAHSSSVRFCPELVCVMNAQVEHIPKHDLE